MTKSYEQSHSREQSKKSFSQITKKITEKSKQTMGNVLSAISIATSASWWIWAPTSIITPAIQTIKIAAPAGKFIPVITLWTATSLLVACKEDEDDFDVTAPNININESEVDITWWKQLRISGNQLFIGDVLVASRKDNESANCTVSISLNWKNISSWTTINEKGNLLIKVTDAAGNSKNASVKLSSRNKAPEINVNKQEIDVSWGKEVSIKWNQLIIWDESIASWSDDNTQNCKTSIKLNWKEIESWSVIKESWTLTITITDDEWLSSTINITLNFTNNAPEVTVHKEEVDITGGKKVSVDGSQLFIWSESVASWSDDNTQNCKVSLKFNDKEIQNWTTIKEKWTLTLIVTDDEGKSSSINIKLTLTNNAPEVTVHKEEVDITGGKKVSINSNKLLIWSESVASWSDDNTQNCKVSLKLNGKDIQDWSTINEKWTLSVSVSDWEWKTTSINIKLIISNWAPEISMLKEEVDVTGGKKVSINSNKLLIWSESVASWSDDNTQNCKVSLKFNGEEIQNWTTIKEKWTLTLIVTDEEGKSSSINIKISITNNAPEISMLKEEVDVTGGKKVSINSNKLLIWSESVASWSDDNTQNCKVSLKFNGEEIQNWATIKEKWTLTLIVTDDEGKVSSADIRITVINNAPEITVKKESINTFWWIKVSISNNQLFAWNDIIASRKDDFTQNCKATLKLNWTEITSWTTINNTGTLTLTVTDDDGKSSKIDINLTSEWIYWLENLNNLNMQVDHEVDLLKWITFAEWVSLVKVEIEIWGKRYPVNDPSHYIPDHPWTCVIVFSVQAWDATVEIKSSTLTIRALDYHAIQISHLEPVDILPIIWQIESGDKQAYEHIEYLRIAEATRIRDMMWKYGAWQHSPAEYQQLMSRLNTGMTMEIPWAHDNFETIWWSLDGDPDSHANAEWYILNNLIKHANFKVLCPNPNDGKRNDVMYSFVQNNPNSINIFWNSSYRDSQNREKFLKRDLDGIKKLCQLDNFLIFVAWTNIKTSGWVLLNKIYNWDYELDTHGVYSLASIANSIDNASATRHMIVTIWTDADWDIDQTNEDVESSKRPVGFHSDVLFAWRTFPHLDYDTWKISTEWGDRNHWKYATSYTNYLNVAIADLCFQMFAEVQNVDQLLDMIRSSTLTDYIRFNGETQNLHLMNPAWFFKKYLMPTDIPSSISSWQIIPLSKWYYKWVIFDIPWAEVKINWEWIPYDQSHQSLIKSQNPMTLEWRLNGDLCTKLWYQWKNIVWNIVVVDDSRNGLNINTIVNISGK